MQGLLTPFDRKSLTRHSSSLVEITNCSAVTISELEKKKKKERNINCMVQVLLATKNLKQLMQFKLVFYNYKYFL